MDIWADALPLCLPHPLHQSRVHGGARSRQTAPRQLALVFGTRFTIPDAAFLSLPFCSYLFFSAQESSRHFPHPVPCMILHHLHHRHYLLLAQLCIADPAPQKLRASNHSQGPQAPVSSPFCSIFPWESPKKSHDELPPLAGTLLSRWASGHPEKKIPVSSCCGSAGVLEDAGFRMSSLVQLEPAPASAA